MPCHSRTHTYISSTIMLIFSSFFLVSRVKCFLFFKLKKKKKKIWSRGENGSCRIFFLFFLFFSIVIIAPPQTKRKREKKKKTQPSHPIPSHHKRGKKKRRKCRQLYYCSVPRQIHGKKRRHRICTVLSNFKMGERGGGEKTTLFFPFGREGKGISFPSFFPCAGWWWGEKRGIRKEEKERAYVTIFLGRFIYDMYIK